MQEWLVPYGTTIWAMGIMGGLILVQILVLDLAGMGSGHVPGAPVTADHGSFFFRATRAHANTNESIAAFVLLALFGILHNAAPGWLNLLAVVYVGARIAHMVCYYLGIGILRSTAFAVALFALIGMLVVGVAAGLR
jgi:uncharacterized MAPEG superfamily protein